MSEYTKGKLELGCICDWELWIGADHHIADVHGNLPTRHTNAIELVRRWNSQPDLLKVCEEIVRLSEKYSNTSETAQMFLRQILGLSLKAKTIIAKAKKE